MSEAISPERVQVLMQGANSIQIITMIFIGIIAIGVIIAVVKWVVDTKTADLPKDIREIKGKLDETTLRVTEIKGKLWSHDEIAREIQSAVNDHALNCPARKNNKD